MHATFQPCLSVIDELTAALAQLAQLDEEKALAVRCDDLDKLNEIIKREQACAMALRGLEQRRVKLFTTLSLDSLPLRALPQHFPPQLQQPAKQAVEAMLEQYQIYRARAEVARNTLECNLHEIERSLQSLQACDRTHLGYTEEDIEVPPAFKTDFRA